MNNLNLSSLLKSHLLDDDGIEDLHFYFVSFNHHKKGILQQHEIIAQRFQQNEGAATAAVGLGNNNNNSKV